MAQNSPTDETVEQNPYIMGAFAPVAQEHRTDGLQVVGEIPQDLFGTFVRNGPNARFAPRGRYHWFDGDGMVHAVHFEDGAATYTNQFVRTPALAAEEAAGHSLYDGVRGDRRNNPGGWWKDTGNTDVVYFQQKILALWYLSGTPFALDPLSLETIGPEDFGGTRRCNISAHAKVDEQTNELFFFDYGSEPPFMRYGVVGPAGQITHQVDIDLPGPRLPHDMAITEHYAILLDLPLFNEPKAFAMGRHKLIFRQDLPSRFGIIPRHGVVEDIRWFEAEPCYFYHVVNAYEEGGEVVLDVCRMRRPAPPAESLSPLEKLLVLLDLEANLYRYRFDLASGLTKEEWRDDRNAEFPMINLGLTGRSARYSYNVTFADQQVQIFDGLVKYDLESGSGAAHRFGEGRFGSEAPFAPRVGSSAEDDGYVVSFVHDENVGRSEVVILDAQDIAAPPIGRVLLPSRVPLGFHGTWIRGEQLPS